ncbi:sensor domain-containing diguanylate cyclase [Halomonas alkaliantarctica]|uniref:sensor domain-containing diguanylate cyclase n=1 Tax=Halomonas alkaliantarctica TaxID=232346 RepID=UPI00265B112B|nr:sensor domain-containing diguanylate cyclase [Halomonas alkaliantarctica]
MTNHHALFEQSVTPLFVVERSMHCSSNVQGNAAFRRVAGWVSEESESALWRCFPFEYEKVMAAINACDTQQVPQYVNVSWGESSCGWQLQLSPVMLGDYRAVHGALLQASLPFGESLDAFLKQLPGFVYQLHYSLEGAWHYSYVSESVEEFFGVSVMEVLADAQTLLDSIHPNDKESVIASSLESARTLRPWQHEFRMFHRNGQIIWVEANDRPHRQQDGSVVWTGYANDITQRKSLETALTSSEQRFRQLVEQANDIIYTLNAAGELTYVSPNWPRILGHRVEEVLGRNINFVLHPEDLEACRHYISKVFQTAKPQGIIEYRVQHISGEWRWHFTNGAPVLDEQGHVTSFLGISHDITPRREMEEQVRRLAQQDSLTQLPNRAQFFAHLAESLQMCEQEGRQLALLFIDLDNFKPVNDRLGHAIGDQLLVQVAQRMKHRLREGDVVGRIGGDEFVAMLSGPLMASEAIGVANQLCNSLAEPFLLAGHRVSISASIGVAMYPLHASEEAALVHRADEAMYMAKAKGRNQAVLYSAALALG